MKKLRLRSLGDAKSRWSMLGVIFSLGILLILPDPSLENLYGQLSLGLWLSVFFQAFSYWYAPFYILLCRSLSILFALVMGIRFQYWLPLVLFIGLAVLMSIRKKRLKIKSIFLAFLLMPLGINVSSAQESNKKNEINSLLEEATAVLEGETSIAPPSPEKKAEKKPKEEPEEKENPSAAEVVKKQAAPKNSTSQANAPALPPPPATESQTNVPEDSNKSDSAGSTPARPRNRWEMQKRLKKLPGYIRGYRLLELASCGNVLNIPWKYKPDGRKTRAVFKDFLRLGTEVAYHWWELHQVLNPDGRTTFIFRRKNQYDKWEYWAARDNIFRKIKEKRSGRKVVLERHDLKKLLEQPVFVFYHENGSKVSYNPRSAGRSRVVVELVNQVGRFLPPIYLQGTYCGRPASLDNFDPNDPIAKQAAKAGFKGKSTAPVNSSKK